jgi:hypothetical protein
MAAGGGMKQRGGRLVRRGRSSGRLPLYGRHARASYRRSPRLNSPYGASSTGTRREPGGGAMGNPEREARAPRGGARTLAALGVLPTSGGAVSGRHEGPDSEAARRSCRRARRATPWRGPSRPNVLLSAGLDA